MPALLAPIAAKPAALPFQVRLDPTTAPNALPSIAPSPVFQKTSAKSCS